MHRRLAFLILLPSILGFNAISQTTFPCREYVTRQIINTGTTTATTELGYVYRDKTTGNSLIVPIDTFSTIPINGLAYYNGQLYAWLQYSSSSTGTGGQAILKLNPNLNGTPSSTTINTSNSAVINAASIDPATGIYYGASVSNSTSTTFIINRVNVSGATPTALNDLTVTLPSGVTVPGAAVGDIAVVGNEMYCYLNSTGLMKYAIPSSSTNAVTCTMVGPNTSGTSNNRTVGSAYWISADPGFLYGFGSAAASSPPAQDRILKIDTLTGAVTELTGGGSTTSQSDGAGCSSGNFTNPLLPDLSGNVFNDVNGLSNSNLVDGIGIGSPSGTKLYANLVNALGNVVDTVAINADGTYTFADAPAGTLTVQISTTKGTIGSAAPAVALPAGWVNTGDVIGTGAGSAATPGISGPITVVAATGLGTASDITNINFGIEQPPTAGSGVNSALNPGGTIQVTVPPNTFTNTTLSSDPSPGGVTAIRITAFPTGATSIVIGGTNYTTLAAITAAYPNGIPTDASGNPTPVITVDPTANGTTSVTIPFVTIDAAGFPSSNTGTAVLNLSAVSISGNVFDDANGLTGTPLNTVDGTGTNAGGLNAVLINTTTGLVVATVPVGAGGTFTFPDQQNGNYSVQITTATATIGNTPPAVTLPSGWVSTGENNCITTAGCTGNDGTVNGILPLGNVTSSITQANFGIEQPPVSVVQAYTIANPTKNTFLTLNGTGTGSGNSPGPLQGSDPEDMSVTGSLSGKTIAITSLPTNGQLWYNGAQITAIGNIANYNPALLQFKFTGSGYKTTSFGYSYIDQAGNASTPSTYSLNWSINLPVNLIKFTGSSNNCITTLNWETAQEIGLDQFVIERSLDGKSFEPIENRLASGTNKLGAVYQYKCSQTTEQTYYRLKMEDLGGAFVYSWTLVVQGQCMPGMITVFPNPVANRLNIWGLNVADKVTIYNAQGQLVFSGFAAGTEIGIGFETYPSGLYEVIVQRGAVLVTKSRIVKE